MECCVSGRHHSTDGCLSICPARLFYRVHGIGGAFSQESLLPGMLTEQILQPAEMTQHFQAGVWVEL